MPTVWCTRLVVERAPAVVCGCELLDVRVCFVLAEQSRRESLAERIPVPFEAVDADLCVRVRREGCLVNDGCVGIS